MNWKTVYMFGMILSFITGCCVFNFLLSILFWSCSGIYFGLYLMVSDVEELKRIEEELYRESIDIFLID